MNQHPALWLLGRLGWPQGFALYLASALFRAAQTTGTALVRHAPTPNGSIDGSVQQMLDEAVTLNSSSDSPANFGTRRNLTVNGNGLLRLAAPNLPPVVSFLFHRAQQTRRATQGGKYT